MFYMTPRLCFHLVLFYLSLSIFLPENFQSIALIITGFVTIIGLCVRKIEFDFRKEVIPFVVFCAVGMVITVANNPNIFNNNELNIQIYMLFSFLIVGFIKLKQSVLKFFISCFTIVNLIISVFVCLDVLVFNGCLYRLFADYLIHPTYFSILGLFSILLLFFIDGIFKGWLSKVVSISIISLSVYLVQSKINLSLLIVVLVLLIIVVGLRKVKSNYVLVLISLSVFGLCAFIFLKENRLSEVMKVYDLRYLLVNLFDSESIKNIEIANPQDSVGVRLANYAIFMLSIDHISFFGKGIGTYVNFVTENCFNFRGGHYCDYVSSFNAHNQFIQIIVELGWFGFALFVLKYFVVVIECIRLKLFRFLPFLVILFFNFLFESLYCRARGVSIVVVLILVFYSYFKTSGSKCVG